MRFSSRVPSAFDVNPWSVRLAERRAAGARLLDLTDANPTRVDLAPELALPQAWDAPALARYEPDARGARRAREAVAGYYAERGAAIDPDDIVLTAGTSESYAHLFRLLADPGDRVLVPRPGYPLFDPIAAAEAVELASYPLRMQRGDDPALDLDAISWSIDSQTRAVVFVQPHHPTGAFLSPDEIARVDQLAASRDIAVISDEVFADFPANAGAESAATGIPSFLGDREALTFVLSGASKVCGLPQMKIGWIALAGPPERRAAARERLEWLADLFLTVSTPGQLALPEWLAARRPWQRRVIERLEQNRARIARASNDGLEFSAGAGWHAVAQFPNRKSEEGWTLDLLERDVIVHPGHFYDFDDDAPRAVLSLIVEPDVLTEGLKRIAQAIANAG